MSRSIAPGQTVPVPFTLSETPDSTPTAAVYQSPADGARSLIGSGTVSVVDGLAYDAAFTVPSDAEHGTAFQLLLSVTIGGETTTYWLDGGTVELWASQASVDEIKAKTDLLGTGQATLVQGGVTVGGEIILRIAAYWTGTLTGLGDLTGYNKLWVTIKRSKHAPDAASIVQWSSTDGLLNLDRKAGVPSTWGTLAIDDAANGDITMTLEADATALLESALSLVYDVKGMNAAGKPVVIAGGVARVEAVVTRAIA